MKEDPELASYEHTKTITEKDLKTSRKTLHAKDGKEKPEQNGQGGKE